jgi:pyruvate kinase
MFSRAGELALETGLAKKGDKVLITAGVPIGTLGTTNLLRIITIGPDGKGI